MVVNRQHPILSPVAFLGAAVLLAGIGLSVWRSGGAAFSPGPLSAQSQPGGELAGFASHAAFENNCNQCHVPLRGVSAQRCEACHQSIAAERAGGGLHGRLPNVADCAACHLDHRGRLFDMTAAAVDRFDHSTTRFSLARHLQDYHGTPLECAGCHAGQHYELQPLVCFDCHNTADSRFMSDHAAAFGLDCLACHDGVDGTAGFDHARTRFPLDGRHAGLACAACHTVAWAPADTPVDCAGCHSEPPLHAGVFTTECAACHGTDNLTPARWDGAPFTHAQTAFALDHHQHDYAGAPIECTGCHAGAGRSRAAFAPFAASTCIQCHGQADAAFMAEHRAEFGDGCVSCHNGIDTLANFDHNRVFPLDGAHAALTCAGCHAGGQATRVAGDCVGCHAEPAIHAGLFGTDCAACHNTTAWVPAALREHTFPLDHGNQGLVACTTCHTQSYASYTCYGCHEHDPARVEAEHREENIGPDQLSACAQCHAQGHKDEDGASEHEDGHD